MFKVRVAFTETYEGRTRAFTHDFDVWAVDPDEALILARQEFERLQSESSVGWIREIKQMSIIDSHDRH